MSAPEMTALKNMPISFPGLFGDWEFNPDPIAIHIGHGIYWYGIILALAFQAAQAQVPGLTQEQFAALLAAGEGAGDFSGVVFRLLFPVCRANGADQHAEHHDEHRP